MNGKAVERHRLLLWGNNPVRKDRLGLSLGLDGAFWLEIEMPYGLPVGLLADQDLVDTGGTAQSRCHIERIACDSVSALLKIHFTCDHQPRIDPCVHGERFADVFLDFVAHGFCQPVNLPGRPDCPDGVIFMGARDTKYGHHSIACIFFHETFVLVDHFSDLRKEAGGDAFHILGIQSL